ncbi:23S rRNA (guanosine(2251)-2'-O)-methyltransferase RlmB [Salinisphaera sp. T31B1]|uniref:23S rRNA (guanosine(2251)-2'-O)-methyltransferase RlmB n=1 Tax=Salinisphaera sp. T31B1 TaxID=727963 RepID=UPI003340C0D5
MTASQDKTFIGGFHAVMAALERSPRPLSIWLANGRRDGRAETLRELAAEHAVPVSSTDMSALDAMLPDVRHQGCIAVYELAGELRESDLPGILARAERPWVLVLDQVQDPHNLGACLRSAAAAGVSAVVAPRKRAAGLTPAVRKVAAGAAERVPFVVVTNIARALERLQAEGYWVVGLDGEAPASLYDTTLPDKLVLVAGGEARGMRERTAHFCDLTVAIPMSSGIESLNVSVATGVALFEARRQRLVVDGTS